jgi:hypothetical protein
MSKAARDEHLIHDSSKRLLEWTRRLIEGVKRSKEQVVHGMGHQMDRALSFKSYARYANGPQGRSYSAAASPARTCIPTCDRVMQSNSSILVNGEPSGKERSSKCASSLTSIPCREAGPDV